MKFFCSGTEIANAANIVSKAVAVDRNIPMQEGINIKAIGKNVTLSAFSNELYIETTIVADVYEEGEVIVNGRLFNECANKISSEERICIEKNIENKLSITFGNNGFELLYSESYGFATLGNYSEDNSFYIKERDLKELYERVIYCMHTGADSRVILKCVSMEVKDEEVESVALDGFRLSISKKPIKLAKGEVKCLILGKIVNDIVKILSDSEEEIKIVKERKFLLIDLAHTKIKVTLSDGAPFNYKNVLLRNENYEVIVNKSELEKTLARTAIISRESNANAVIITIKNDVMNIYSNNEKGKISENVACKCNCDEIRIGVNNKYLSDAVGRIKEDYLKIVIEDHQKPIIIRKIDGEDYISIILPIKLT